MKRIFLNYRREDSGDVAKRIHEVLSRSFRKRVMFIDIEAIPPAMDYRKVILRSIDQAGVFLALIGPEWLACVDKDGRRRIDSPDDPVRSEIENAMLRDVTILPVLVGGATMPAPDDLPVSLRNLAYQNALCVRVGQEFEKDIENIKDVVRGIVASSRRMLAPTIASACLIALAGGLAGYYAASVRQTPPGRSYGDVNGPDLKKVEPVTILKYRYKIPEIADIGFYLDDSGASKYSKVPVTLGRKRLGSSKDLFDDLRINVRALNSPSSADYPDLVEDLVGGSQFWLKCLKEGGGSSFAGTLVMASPYYRPNGEDYILAPEKAMVAIEDDGGVLVETRSHVGTAADFVVTRHYAVPKTDQTTVNLSIKFRAEEAINLGVRGSATDRFRFLTLSSQYENATDYDANVILYEDRARVVRQIRLNEGWMLNEPERNGDYLFKEVDDESRSFGSWFELVKEPGSSRNPETPSIRVDVVNSGGLKLGIEGYLYRNKETNKRFVDCWVEWQYDPAEIAAGTEVGIEFKITASPPRLVASDIPRVARKTTPYSK